MAVHPQWVPSLRSTHGSLDLPHGIPSHDTFNRVFSALDPLHFQSWMEAVRTMLPAEVIALDGKTVRGSRGSHGKSAIHMVSAWAATNRLVLAQVKVDTNTQRVPDEITALPDLLPQLAVAGCIVTIDAMGCQRTIAQQILDQDGDYVLGLKGNQGTLEQDVEFSVATAKADGFAGIRHEQAETRDKGHGRIETRRAVVIDDPAVLAWLQERHAWPGLEAIGVIHAERRIGDTRTSEDRVYLLSHPLSAPAFGDAVRSHWGDRKLRSLGPGPLVS